MQRSYTLLLHETVRAHIVSLNSQAKHRLREKLEFLQGGLWDAGVRVKKLKGTAARCSRRGSAAATVSCSLWASRLPGTALTTPAYTCGA